MSYLVVSYSVVPSPPSGGGRAVGGACGPPKPPMLTWGASPRGPPDLHGEGSEPDIKWDMSSGHSTMAIVHVLWPYYMYYGHSTCTIAIIHVLWP